MKPSIGRIVHFVHGGVHYAAIVVKVWSDVCVNLYVLPNGSERLASDRLSQTHGADDVALVFTSVMRADLNGEGQAPEHSWHWPERDEATP
jgi:hypothetical protein